jgi:hypothetical protein
VWIPAPLLSPRQAQLISTIEKLTRDRDGLPPTLREVSVAMGVHPSRVAQLARSTEQKGALAREPRTARSWKIIKNPPKRP